MNQITLITISKFKATCLAVLDGVKRTGRSVLVKRHGKPIAIIAPSATQKEGFVARFVQIKGKNLW
jgi:antitoxin (DNA-binding transcriptional repressor) of toxin-antitoxin stability system